MLLALYTNAEQKNADISTCQFIQIYENNMIKYQSNYIESDKDKYFRNLLSAKYYSVICNSIYKQSLFKNYHISFPEEIDYEDVGTTYKLFFYAQKLAITNKTYYYWRYRNNSRNLTGHTKKKHIDSIFQILKATKEFLAKEQKFNQYSNEFYRRVYHYVVGLLHKQAKSISPSLKNTEYILKNMKMLHYDTKKTLLILKDFDYKLWQDYMNYKQITENIKNITVEECEKKLFQFILLAQDTEKYKTQAENRNKDIEKYKTQVENRNKDIEKYKTQVENRKKDIEKLKTVHESCQNKLRSIYQTLHDTVKIPFYRNPLKKYKAYRKLIKDIYATKEK
jgi:hypothetical protein